MSDADELRAAAKILRERAKAAAGTNWADYPWVAEESGDLCMVHQGQRQPDDHPQVPPIDYICDAETPERAAYIALMEPPVALAVANLLEVLSWFPSQADKTDLRAAAVVARAVLRGEASRG